MKKKLLLALLTSAMLLLAACGGEESADGGEVFEFGAQSYTDPKIAAQMVKILVEENTDHEVNITEDIQASPQIIASIDREEFDFAMLYSGEVYNNHFDDVEYSTNSEQTIENAQKYFGEEYDITWFDSIGFKNEYSIAIQGQLQDSEGIENISDLEPLAGDLRLGTDTSWVERDNDGYRGFQDAYGFEFGDVRAMEVSLMYEGIKNDELDVVTAYTVDPQIAEYDLRVLEDDVEFFPPYDASLVARNEVLDNYPEVKEIFDNLVGTVSTEQMSQLILEVDLNGRPAEEVAREFLENEGLLN
ncbi:osmoprotectant transport system substrate-binding protein [Halolactibacillus halophilus]|uniref:Glycine betaine/carnitine/choline-binding protein OpuCC n=1 Tax=Halolactibacillus halophilus TaxID=306540 RepID=A0A1I5MW07_9BACI|nr:glycine betaine ABC transporter substrate-binding protein [Halolactibacillus halophilus]GEM01277.1 glycine betaine/carnitine/choline-binding protein OpuCC [Halolactibacillus halophilus]SFP13201.1 osmoprotectant transport system substrate-binding protein [Halolactibacillus halophilus]